MSLSVFVTQRTQKNTKNDKLCKMTSFDIIDMHDKWVMKNCNTYDFQLYKPHTARCESAFFFAVRLDFSVIYRRIGFLTEFWAGFLFQRSDLMSVFQKCLV